MKSFFNKFKGLKKSTRSNLVTFALCLMAFGIVTTMVATGNATRHMKSLLVPICINIILTVSLNLVIGFLGELSLGHAGFMSVGAYAACLFSIRFEEMLPVIIRFPLAMLVGGLAGAVFGLLVGIPVLRLKGDYLAIVTLAFGEILRSIIINLEFTGGASGLKGMPQDSTFNWGALAVAITLFVVMNLVDSRHGRAIMAIRENAIAASAVGININRYKLMVFAVAAFFAGVAGALYGHNYSIMSAGTFDYNKSIEILVMVVLGGMGNIRGSVISATLITVLPEMLRGLADYRMLIYAVVLITMMLLGTSEKFMMLRYKLEPKRLVKKAMQVRQNRLDEEEARKNG
ncbi:MAG: branched-chain amino acid ABC transporter permease [Oscillospiraceae bacterium]|nr:branched-chain amino acid ABC transporter permease [Oscillospiraceae bacterium]